jgi:hypothetical protein
MQLTKAQAARLKYTIEIAREGKATLPQLANAHELAQQAGLVNCAAELRAHIRAVAADHDVPHQRAGRDVLTGVISGVITHALLGAL